MKFQKGFASIILEIAVVAILIGAFIYASPKFKNSPQPTPSPVVSPSPSSTNASPTPNNTGETADWKTYSSNQFGFSFKYPPELFIRKDSGKDFIGFLQIPNQNSSSKLIVSISQNPSNMDIKEFRESGSNDSRNVTHVITKINGYPALIERYQLLTGDDRYYLVSIKGDKFIVNFSLDYPFTDTEENEKWLNQILSTFKFLDSSPQPSPSKKPTACIQVIQPARNPKTKECKLFPTPCDVPEDWEEVSSCDFQ